MTNPASETSGKRLAALREACGLTQHQVADESARLAQVDPARFQRMGRSHLANQEVAEVTPIEKSRVTLAQIFGIAPDDLRSYLAGEIGLDDALEARRARATGEAPRSGVADPAGAPRLRTHPRWAELCTEAMAIAPELKPETLRSLGDKPWLYGPIEGVDVHLLVDLATGLQRWKRRNP